MRRITILIAISFVAGMWFTRWIVGVTSDQIVILDRRMVNTDIAKATANLYQVTPELLSHIKWLLMDAFPSVQTESVVKSWISAMERMLAYSETPANYASTPTKTAAQ